MTKINPIVDPTHWANQLKSAVDAHKPAAQQKGSVAGHKYMTVSGGKYSLTSKRSDKLPLARITAISIDAIKKLKEDYLAKSDLKPGDVRRYSEAASDIAKQTNALIQARVAKRDQPHKLFFRTLAKVILAVASLVLIGLPFFIMMRNADRKFAREIGKLQQELQQTTNTSSGEVSKKATELAAQAKKAKEAEKIDNILMLIAGNFEKEQIDKLLQVEEVVPPLLDRLRKISDQLFDDPFDQVNRKAEKTAIYTQLRDFLALTESHEKELDLSFGSASALAVLKYQLVHETIPSCNTSEQADYIKDDLNFNLPKKQMSSAYPGIEEHFAKDMNRGIRFSVNDSKIDDSIFPRSELEKTLTTEEEKEANADGIARQKIRNGALVIGTICDEGNEAWKFPMQIAATQLTLMNLAEKPLTVMNMSTPNIKWEEEERTCYLKPKLQDPYPPIEFTVHRNSDNLITRVDVKVIGEVNLVKSAGDDPLGQNDVILFPKAAVAELTYSITLGEDDQPKVDNVKCHYTTEIKSPFAVQMKA